MYKVQWKAAVVAREQELDSLDEAMRFAKEIDYLVTIKGNGMEVIGLFGADGIANGKCPDGVDYTWKKRRL